MIILGIESSCDETSAAVVQDGRLVLSNVIYSQIELHQKFGGVVPEIASRSHIEKIDAITREALRQAGLGMDEIDAIAVTYGPGLVGALLVGLSFAKGLAYATGKPLIGVHHIEGHIAANYLDSGLEPPFVCLVVSGGHTHLIDVAGYGEYELIGRTKDDAAGEAFDKVARALGLGYPGGPKIDEAAKTGNPSAVAFPRAMLADGFDFSFSGLKSAVLNYLNKAAMTGAEVVVSDVAASFQKALVDVLVHKSIEACKTKAQKKLVLAGGVSCNLLLREEMRKACEANGISLFAPRPVYCTDNAAMIAACAYFDYMTAGRVSGLGLNAAPTLKISEKLGAKP